MKNLLISSANRSQETDSPSDYSLVFDRPLPKGEYKLCYAFVPNSVRTIVAGVNDTFRLNGSLVTITQGIYSTTTSFASAIQTAMNNVLAGFTVTITDNFINIAHATAFVLDFTGKAIARTLGFPKTVQPSTTSLTGSGFVNFSTRSFAFNILVNNFVTFEDNKSNGYTFRIPITSNTLGYTSYEPNTFVQTVQIPHQINRLDIKMFDDEHNPIDLNYIDWYMYWRKL